MADISDAEVQVMMARTAKTTASTDKDLDAEVQAMMARTANKKDKKKKKKDKKKKTDKKKTSDPGPKTQQVAAPSTTYSYDMLLKRVYAFIERDNPDQLRRNRNARLKLPALNMCRYKTTRTNWSNFYQVCQVMERPLDHVMTFIERELAVHASINRNRHLILPTRIESRRMGQILHKYVVNYVMCVRCNSHRTAMRKDRVRRITFMECTECQAQTAVKSVHTQRAGHVAVKRGDRYRARHGLK